MIRTRSLPAAAGLVALAGLAVTAVGLVALPGAASAYEPSITGTCDGIVLTATSYDDRPDNVWSVTVDGDTTSGTFGVELKESFEVPQDREVSWSARIAGWDGAKEALGDGTIGPCTEPDTEEPGEPTDDPTVIETLDGEDTCVEPDEPDEPDESSSASADPDPGDVPIEVPPEPTSDCDDGGYYDDDCSEVDGDEEPGDEHSVDPVLPGEVADEPTDDPTDATDDATDNAYGGCTATAAGGSLDDGGEVLDESAEDAPATLPDTGAPAAGSSTGVRTPLLGGGLLLLLLSAGLLWRRRAAA